MAALQPDPGLEAPDWADAVEKCIHCDQTDFVAGFGPRTLLICSCCQAKGTHVECEEKHSGTSLSEVDINSQNWFCSQACSEVCANIKGLAGVKIPLEGNQTVQLCKWNLDCKASVQSVESALKIFKASFAFNELDGGADLIELVCNSRKAPDGVGEDEDYDYSDFHIVLLRSGAVAVSAATLRVFGTRFAEVPFVATRDGYRHGGNLHRLVQAIENMLMAMGVRFMVVPSVAPLLNMWTHKFGFERLSAAECTAIEDQIVMMDPETTYLLKKALVWPGATPKIEKEAQPSRKQEGKENSLPAGEGALRLQCKRPRSQPLQSSSAANALPADWDDNDQDGNPNPTKLCKTSSAAPVKSADNEDFVPERIPGQRDKKDEDGELQLAGRQAEQKRPQSRLPSKNTVKLQSKGTQQPRPRPQKRKANAAERLTAAKAKQAQPDDVAKLGTEAEGHGKEALAQGNGLPGRKQRREGRRQPGELRRLRKHWKRPPGGLLGPSDAAFIARHDALMAQAVRGAIEEVVTGETARILAEAERRQMEIDRLQQERDAAVAMQKAALAGQLAALEQQQMAKSELSSLRSLMQQLLSQSAQMIRSEQLQPSHPQLPLLTPACTIEPQPTTHASTFLPIIKPESPVPGNDPSSRVLLLPAHPQPAMPGPPPAPPAAAGSAGNAASGSSRPQTKVRCAAERHQEQTRLDFNTVGPLPAADLVSLPHVAVRDSSPSKEKPSLRQSTRSSTPKPADKLRPSMSGGQQGEAGALSASMPAGLTSVATLNAELNVTTEPSQAAQGLAVNGFPDRQMCSETAAAAAKDGALPQDRPSSLTIPGILKPMSEEALEKGSQPELLVQLISGEEKEGNMLPISLPPSSAYACLFGSPGVSDSDDEAGSHAVPVALDMSLHSAIPSDSRRALQRSLQRSCSRPPTCMPSIPVSDHDPSPAAQPCKTSSQADPAAAHGSASPGGSRELGEVPHTALKATWELCQKPDVDAAMPKGLPATQQDLAARIFGPGPLKTPPSGAHQNNRSRPSGESLGYNSGGEGAMRSLSRQESISMALAPGDKLAVAADSEGTGVKSTSAALTQGASHAAGAAKHLIRRATAEELAWGSGGLVSEQRSSGAQVTQRSLITVIRSYRNSDPWEFDMQAPKPEASSAAGQAASRELARNRSLTSPLRGRASADSGLCKNASAAVSEMGAFSEQAVPANDAKPKSPAGAKGHAEACSLGSLAALQPSALHDGDTRESEEEPLMLLDQKGEKMDITAALSCAANFGWVGGLNEL